MLPPITAKPYLIRLFGFISFFFSLFVYYLTTCPVIYYGDAGELTVAAYRWGIAHPPGYPGYIIPLGIFLRLPLSFLAPHSEFLQPIAWQANFFSAVMGAFTIWVVYLIILRLTRTPWIALAGSILATFGRTFWSQTGIAEVYTLNAFFAMLLILLAIVQGEARPGSRERVKWLKWGSAIWGLSLANHHEMAFFFPVWLTMVGMAMIPAPGSKRPILPPIRILIEGIIYFIIGLTPYLYLPIASAMNPPLNWGDPATFSGFFKVLSRADYREIKASITGDLITSLDILVKFTFWTFLQYGPIAIIFALPGFSIFFKRSPHRPALVASAISLFLMNTAFTIYFTGIDRPSLFFLEVYFIPWYLAIAILVAISFNRIRYMFKFKSPISNITYGAVAFGLILLLSFTAFVQNHSASDMSDNIEGYIYSHDVLASLPAPPEKSILVVAGDEIFLYWYWKWVEILGKDVAVIGTDALGVTHSWFWDDVARDQPTLVLPGNSDPGRQYQGDELSRKMLEALIRDNRHAYRVFMSAWEPVFDPILSEGPWHMVLDGPVLEIEWDSEGNISDYPRRATGIDDFKFEALFDVSRDNLAPFEEEVFDRYAAACYNLAIFASRHNEYALAVQFIQYCLKFQPGYNPGEHAMAPKVLLAVCLTKAGFFEPAKAAFNELISENPRESLYHSYLAEIYFAEGDTDSAKRELETALEIEPDNIFIRERYEQLIESLGSSTGN
ncbi:MAG: DUF2723 domain-containing protein [bacterium]|nr:DUF2723 domain-containing protein [bacterium]